MLQLKSDDHEAGLYSGVWGTRASDVHPFACHQSVTAPFGRSVFLALISTIVLSLPNFVLTDARLRSLLLTAVTKLSMSYSLTASLMACFS